MKLLQGFAWGIVACFLFLSACGRSEEGQSIRVAGSTTVLPIIEDAAKKYRRRHPDIKIYVSAGGSGVGLRSLMDGLANIGMMSREMDAVEKEKYKGVRLQFVPVALDAVAVAVSSEVVAAGVKDIAREELEGIFSGRIGNWKSLGGPDREIFVIDKELTRGTREVFMEYVFGDPRHPAPGADIIVGANNESRLKVSQSDAAITMLSLGWMNEDVRALPLRTEWGTIVPSPKTIRSGKYPITRKLNLVLKPEAAENVRSFVDFVLSDEIQEGLSRFGYVPLKD